MANKTYIQNRWKTGGRQRPQAIAWSNNLGIVDDGLLVPDGSEFEDFIILSDDNRSEISIAAQRIENKRRMINGNLRSYHIADKMQINWNWVMLPSRSHFQVAAFDDATGLSPYQNNTQEFTADGGAGGVAILD